MTAKRAPEAAKSKRVFGQRQESPEMFRVGLYARVSTRDQQTLPLQMRVMRSTGEARLGDGTLLDHSMIVYVSGISDGNGHDHGNLPTILAETRPPDPLSLHYPDGKSVCVLAGSHGN